MMRLAPIALIALLALPRAVAAQEWRATAQAGRVNYASTPTGAAADASMVLGLSRAAPASWIGLSAALPLGADPFWAVLAGWKRFATSGTAGALLDVTGHGFVQRQRTAGALPTGGLTTADRQGAGADVRAGIFARNGTTAFEVRGGAAAQRSEQQGVIQSRFLPAADARVSLLRAPFTLSAEGRGWATGTERHAWTGGTLQIAEGPVMVSGGAGNWVTGGVHGITWTAAARAGVGHPLELQLAARGNSFDPLYRSATGTTFSLGLSARIGRAPFAGVAPVAPRGSDGRSVIRIATRDAGSGPSIAGDFTNWKPVPMQRDGGHWIYAAHLEPGVYHYAFVAGDGHWFVPKSVPGRQADGMGGETAVLVVAS